MPLPLPARLAPLLAQEASYLAASARISSFCWTVRDISSREASTFYWKRCAGRTQVEDGAGFARVENVPAIVQRLIRTWWEVRCTVRDQCQGTLNRTDLMDPTR